MHLQAIPWLAILGRIYPRKTLSSCTMSTPMPPRSSSRNTHVAFELQAMFGRLLRTRYVFPALSSSPMMNNCSIHDLSWGPLSVALSPDYTNIIANPLSQSRHTTFLLNCILFSGLTRNTGNHRHVSAGTATRQGCFQRDARASHPSHRGLHQQSASLHRLLNH
jgi:hypothetical protein